MWGMIYKKNVDYAELIWEDFQFQIDNRHTNAKRWEHIPYPRFTKVIINHFLSNRNSLPKRQASFINKIKYGSVLGKLKFVHKGEEHQKYGMSIPDSMMSDAIRNSTHYMTYLALSTNNECMRTRSSSNLVGEFSPNPTTSNPKRRNRRRSKQPFLLEESPVDTMADQHTMAELLRAPTEGYAEAIMVPPILAEHFELKHSVSIGESKLLEKLGDPRKFLIPCGFGELKCKALADLGASIKLVPLSAWKKLGLPELISTRKTLELANRAICTPAGIARDVFVPIGKFIFPADFVIVDYESDPRVPLILGRPFLRIARALIDVHGEEMILRDDDERLILNMRHDTSSYSNKPKKESINMIDIYNVSYEDYLEDLFANEKITNHLSGNPTPISDPIVSSSPTLTFLEESDLIWEEFEAYLESDSFPPGSDDTDFDPEGDLHLIEELLNDPSSLTPLSHNPLSGSTTSSSPNHFLEEFADELALTESFPPGNGDMNLEDVIREI
ncbi:reverse transcriptase domain-containing protein [Tanacetum coccineum]